jgi:hypothetical protein
VRKIFLFVVIAAGCGSSGPSTSPPDGAPTDAAPVPCQGNNPGVIVTLDFAEDAGPTCPTPTTCLTTLTGEFLMSQSAECGPTFAMPWPSGIHPNLGASISFTGSVGGTSETGTAQLVAKPTMCVSVTIPITCP